MRASIESNSYSRCTDPLLLACLIKEWTIELRPKLLDGLPTCLLCLSASTLPDAKFACRAGFLLTPRRRGAISSSSPPPSLGLCCDRLHPRDYCRPPLAGVQADFFRETTALPPTEFGEAVRAHVHEPQRTAVLWLLDCMLARRDRLPSDESGCGSRVASARSHRHAPITHTHPQRRSRTSAHTHARSGQPPLPGCTPFLSTRQWDQKGHQKGHNVVVPVFAGFDIP